MVRFFVLCGHVEGGAAAATNSGDGGDGDGNGSETFEIGRL